MKGIRLSALVVFVLATYGTASALAADVTVDAAAGRRSISPYVYGKNLFRFGGLNDFNAEHLALVNEAGVHIARTSQGNNGTKYNWENDLSSYPDWYNNVYPNSWPESVQVCLTQSGDLQILSCFQALGWVAKTGGDAYNYEGSGNPSDNLCGGGDTSLYLQPWTATDSVNVVDYWFNTLGYDPGRFLYWHIDNEPGGWTSTHDDITPSDFTAEQCVQRYIAVAKEVKNRYPGITVMAPGFMSEWYWWNWSDHQFVSGMPWCEYFIYRMAQESQSFGTRLFDMLNMHIYTDHGSQSDAQLLQEHRIFYDPNYQFPAASGCKRWPDGGWHEDQTVEYIFGHVEEWLDEHFGPGHGITIGSTEGGLEDRSPMVNALWYASVLGTFVDHGIEVFTPWYWAAQDWEVVHLFSRYGQSIRVQSTSTYEEMVSAYSSVNEAGDAMTIILLNRHPSSAQTANVSVSNFSVPNGSYTTQRLSNLPSGQTFYSHTNNALAAGSVNVSGNSFSLSLPAYSITAVLLSGQGGGNNAPVANNDSYSTDRDVPLNVSAPGVLGNDSDADSDPLTAIKVSDPPHGSVTVFSNGGFQYTPDAGYSGSDSFTYKANDGQADSNTATVSVSVVPPAGNGSGLTGQYYDNMDFTSLALSRTDATVAFDWGDGSPDASVGADTFSVRWTGQVQPLYSETYTFYTRTDDGARLWVNGQQIIDQWVDQGPTEVSGTISLTAGVKYDIQFDYYENGGGAVAELRWSSAAQAKEIVPQLQLYPSGGDVTPPAAPTGLSATGGEGQVSLDWNDNSEGDLDGYRVYRSTSSGSGYSQIADVSSSAHTDSGVAGGTTYYYVVTAYDTSSNESGYSNEASATPQDTTAPAAPTGLSAAPGSGQVILDWNDNSEGDLDGYRVYRSTTSGSGYSQVADVSSSAHTDSGLTNGTTYYYVVAAYDTSDNESGYSNEASATPQAVTYDANVVQTAAAPAIDGTLDAAWSAAPVYAMSKVLLGSASSDSDLSGNWRAMWDSSNLYVYVSVLDDTDVHDNADNPWDDDSVEIYVDADNSKGTSYDGVNDYQYGFERTDGTVYTGYSSVTNTSGIQFSMPTQSGGYVLEVSIPWSTLGVSVSQGSLVGLDVHVNDDDDGGSTRECKKAWFAITDDSWGDPSTFGTVELVAGGPPNNAPVASDDSYGTDEDQALSVSAPGVLGNDSDAESDPLTAVKVSDPSHGSVTLDSDGSFAYTPDANYNGSDSFTYKANDGSLDSNTATVTITISAVNDAPVASDDSYGTDEDQTLNVSAPGVLGNDSDADGDSLSAVLVGDVSHGSLTLNPNGSFSYTPDAGYSGGDSFTYRANDGTANSGTATVTITVSEVNNPPSASDDSYSTDEDQTLNVSAPGVLGNDDDPDGDTLSAVLVGDVSNGSLTLNSNGSFTYTPEANANGTDSFTYRASDGSLNSNTATVTITVSAVNDAPVAAGDSYTVAQDDTLSVSAPGVLGNDSDVDGDALSAVLVSDVSNGSLTLNSNGSFSYTPDAGYSGSDSFEYKANDGAADSNTVTVSITVTPATVYDASVTETDTAPTIDGTLDAVWSSAPVYAMSNVLLGSASSDSDLSGNWRAMWDSSNLYVYVSVLDDTDVHDTANNPWDDDSVEIYIDADNSKGTSYDGVNDYQYGFERTDGTVYTGYSSATNTSGIQFSMPTQSGGYVLEVSIPWSTLDVWVSQGSLIGLDVHVNDDDDGGSTRECKKAWFATADDSWSDPSTFATAELVPGAPDTTPPDPPTGLSATAGEGQVSLDWNNNSEPDLDGYKVYRSTTSGSGYSQIADVSSSAHTDTGVTNGTTYYYVVTAYDTSANESGYSNEASATPQDATAPAAPTGLSAMAGDGQVSLDWNNNSEGDLDGYRVYRSTTSGSGYSQIAGPSSSAYTDNGVTNGTTYYYVVTAYDTSNNESGYSNEASATPQAGGGGTTTYNFVGVTQSTADYNAYACDVDVFPFGGSSSNRNSQVEATNTQYTNISANNTAQWATADPGSSDEIFLWLEMKINESAGNITQIDLTFNGNTDGSAATEHRIYVMTAGANWVQSASWTQVGTGQSIPQDVDTTMTRSITSNISSYIDGSGNIVWGVYETRSSEDLRINYVEMVVHYSGGDTTPPAAPTGLNATAGDAQVALDWNDNGEGDLDGYRVYRSTTSGSAYSQIAGPSSSAYTDNGVSNGTTYYYVVTAYDTSNNESGYSNEASATPQGTGGLPAPWQSQDVGNPDLAGSASYDGGTFTVIADGTDISGTSDAFHYVYQTCSGDAEIVARVVSLGTVTQDWAKAGIMFRESLNGDSAYALGNYTTNVARTVNSWTILHRDTTGGTSTQTIWGTDQSPPYWLRLVRTGNNFSCYVSSNGSSWELIDTVTISMASNITVGLAVTSHDSTNLVTGVFDNVSVTP
jgi:VCBS repeat-containing protein